MESTFVYGLKPLAISLQYLTKHQTWGLKSRNIICSVPRAEGRGY